MRQKRLACFQKVGDKRYDDDMFVDLTIYDVPAGLLRDFCKKIVQPNCPGGVSDAIKDLMRKAVNEKQQAITQATS